MTFRNSILALALVLIFSPVSFSQELKVVDFMHVEMDISAREHQRLDINDEPCSLIKARTGFTGLEFNSNRGIEAVEYRNGEYWIWVSPGTNMISIYLKDFPLFDYYFQFATRASQVYKLTILGILPDSANMDQFGETFISFTSQPDNAEVYLNNIFQGKTPLKLSFPAGEYSYRLERSRYIDIEGYDSIYEGVRKHDFILEYDYFQKRIVLLPSVSFSNPPGGETWGSDKIPLNMSYGFTFGIFGGTGFFISCNGYYKAVEPELIFDSNQMTYTTTSDISEYWFRSLADYDDLINNITLSAGITQQLSRKLFLRAGGGYYIRKCFSSAEKFAYEDGYNPARLPDEAWVYMLYESFAGMNLLAGIDINIGKHLLLDFSISGYFEFANGLMYRSSDLGVGIGCIF